MEVAGREGCACGGARLVGDYILGPRIGSGSFAVVWRATHRRLGVVVAVKEIDKEKLSTKARDCLLKEITILRDISHPNIVHLHEAIQTEERIYLVLEYCTGGDLAGYLQRYGRITQSVARHFMQQLASGLQVLHKNSLIHRDLKPQNLFLSTKNDTLVLKIGDFGFARYLTPQGLAETHCGSPLYMAPEIIQNQRYDAKADLWSVGVILFQLVTGRPPFKGNNPFQLFQNILASKELQFPSDVMQELHPDCIDLCKGLLRQNPAGRLTFEEFFNHKFMVPRRTRVASESLLNIRTWNMSSPAHVDFSDSYDMGDAKLIAVKSADRENSNTSNMKVRDSLEFVEHDYVIVNAYCNSLETVCSSFEISLQDDITSGPAKCTLKDIGDVVSGHVQAEEPDASFTCGYQNVRKHACIPLLESLASNECILQEKSQMSLYICTLTELAHEKLEVGLLLESFSVELVLLAMWKTALQECISCQLLTSKNAVTSSKLPFRKNYIPLSHGLAKRINASSWASVYSWVKKGFIIAFDRTERLSNSIRDMYGNAEMPDAMEIIFQAALTAGKNGAVEELMGNGKRAAAWYSKAKALLLFILVEATSLPLNPPLLLSITDQQRIHGYITNLQSHIDRFTTYTAFP